MILEKVLERKLLLFDGFDLKDKVARRAAVWPLYDFYQILILEVCVSLCELYRSPLEKVSLQPRWKEFKKNLEDVIEIPQKYNDRIKSLHKIRHETVHNDYYTPPKDALLKPRKMAPEFMEWIIKAGRMYHDKHIANKTFTQRFLQLSKSYINRTDWILSIYGEKLPFSAKVDMQGKNFYHEFKETRNLLETRQGKIHCANDITKGDIDHLIGLVTEVERLDAKEYVYLQYETCPKCGGKIVDTQQAFGGCPDDPIPYAISCRVGCEECDYEVFSDTVEI